MRRATEMTPHDTRQQARADLEAVIARRKLWRGYRLPLVGKVRPWQYRRTQHRGGS
jgi:hypothetical protein